MNGIELLAPAASLDILKAAVDRGCDAVYIGLKDFNARANSVNFTEDDLIEGCEYAHLRSRNVYLTLNTLINDDELDRALEAALTAYNGGIDAILVQDIGLASYISSKYPQIVLHASTQMNIDSENDYRQLARLNIKRVVLPRELTIDEIKKHTRNAARYGISTEVFCQGAICMCYSGLCLYSSMNKSGSRSGNRGLCAQPCRQEYELCLDGNVIKKGHLLSPKDRSVLPVLSELIEIGVASLKIEGRMRDIDYVSNTVSVYRELIDSCRQGTLDDAKIKEGEKRLLVSFNRGGGFTTQSLLGHDRGFFSGEYPGKYGLILGTVTGQNNREGTLNIRLSEQDVLPAKGDYLSVRRKGNEICSFPAGKVEQSGDHLVVKGLHPDRMKSIERGSEVYLMNHDLSGRYEVRGKTMIDLSVDIAGGKMSIDASVCEGRFTGLFADVSADQENGINPVDQDRISSQLKKTGNTPFEVRNIYFTNEVSACVRISTVNDMRRKLCELLEDKIITETSAYIPEGFDMFGDESIHDASEEGSGTVRKLVFYPSVGKEKRDLFRGNCVYAFSAYDIIDPVTRSRIEDFCSRREIEFMIVIPDAVHEDIRKKMYYEVKNVSFGKLTGVIDQDIFGDHRELKDAGISHYLSAGRNIYNRRSLGYALQNSDGAFISYESSPEEMFDMIRSVSASGKALFLHHKGEIPWMQTDRCIIGNECRNCSLCEHGSYILRPSENRNSEIAVKGHKADHSNHLYGPSKYSYSEEDARKAASYGYDVYLAETVI